MAIICKVKFTPKEPRIFKASEWEAGYRDAAIAATRMTCWGMAGEVQSRMSSQTGTTRRSVGVDVQANGMRVVGFVGSPKKEALFMEKGTGPQHIGEGGATRAYWPPIKRLRIWARRVVGDERFAYYLQRKIRGLIPGKLGGTPALRPFERTAREYTDKAIEVYERMFAALANRMSS